MTRKIPRFELSLSKDDFNTIIHSTMDDGLTKANAYDCFETQFANYIGVKHAVIVPSARMGLYSILKNMELDNRDEIILPSLTYHAVPSMLLFLGFKPVFADVNQRTYTIEAATIEEKITENTKAIIPTHLYGLPCDMGAISHLASRYNLKIIEDCAQACGAIYYGKRVGSLGDAGIYSFGLTKNITSFGGGVITTNDQLLADCVRKEVDAYRLVGNFDLLKRLLLALVVKVLTNFYVFEWTLFPLICLSTTFGTDFIHNLFREKERLFDKIPLKHRTRMSNIQANITLGQLKRLDILNAKRRENAEFLINNLGNNKGIRTPLVPEGVQSVFTGFVIQADERDRLAVQLLRKGIDTSKGYVRACSSLPTFENFAARCPNAEKLDKHMLHLPIYPALSRKDLCYISDCIKGSLKY